MGRAIAGRPFFERRATADRGNHCTRDDRTDARHGHDPSATVITFCQRLDLISRGFDALIALPPVTGELSDDADHAGRENVCPLGWVGGQRLAKETQSVPADNATRQKKAAYLIDGDSAMQRSGLEFPIKRWLSLP